MGLGDILKKVEFIFCSDASFGFLSFLILKINDRLVIKLSDTIVQPRKGCHMAALRYANKQDNMEIYRYLLKPIRLKVVLPHLVFDTNFRSDRNLPALNRREGSGFLDRLAHVFYY